MKKNLSLLIATILIWGTVWYAIKFQLGETPIIVSVFHRILLAAVVLIVYCVVKRVPLALPLREHLPLALMGLFLFSGNYYFFYVATGHIESGLVSIVFSTLVLVNSLNKRLFFGERIDGMVILGGTVGIVGVALTFGGDLVTGRGASERLVGIGYAFLATYMVSLGNLISARCSRRGIPVAASTGLGLVYGTLSSGAIVLWQGAGFAVPTTPVYLASLLYLSLFCTAIAFLLYLGLVENAGPDKAALATLLFPVVALAISSVAEGYRWTPTAVVGVGLVLIGSSLSFFGDRVWAAWSTRRAAGAPSVANRSLMSHQD